MEIKKKRITCFLILGLSCGAAFGQRVIVKMNPVNFAQVQINDKFWSPRIRNVTDVTIPLCINQTELVTPRIRNFEKVARKQGERHEGIYFDDSDVYKALEAIAYSLKNHPDAKLEAKADEWIEKIAAAQQPDGYLNTYFTLNGIDERWTDMEKHEDYCAGHLFEAAVAYFNTTGKRKLLNVATRLADHIDSALKQKDIHWLSGHEEIELALVKLYKVTGKVKYLDLADWYLQQRGHGYGKGAIWTNKDMGKKYCQDDVPVKDQREIEGHAVRAMYLYTGASDVAAAKNDTGYLKAMNAVWEDVVFRNMYLTGGIGSSGNNEGFTTDYDLPNSSAYCETCASVGMVIWNERMNMLTGNSKYVDVLEKSLYNAALDGLSLKGDRFFYGNPLSSSNNYQRSEWFGTACCPPNIARLIESLGNYIYASADNDIWVNLFVGSSTTIPLKSGDVEVKQQTSYPWSGQVNLVLSPFSASIFSLHIRIPGWANNEATPGNAYRYTEKNDSTFSVTVNGKPAKFTMELGYVVIQNKWQKGDVVALNLPMPVRMVRATDSIKADRNKVALQRGPLIYCVEQLKSAGREQTYLIPKNAVYNTVFDPTLLNGIMYINAKIPSLEPTSDGKGVEFKESVLTAIPYFSWANRGQSQMNVWLPSKIESVRIKASKDDN